MYFVVLLTAGVKEALSVRSSHFNMWLLKPNFKFSISFAAQLVKKKAQASFSIEAILTQISSLTETVSSSFSNITITIINTYYSENSGQ